jgi:hypothetical protein
MALKTKLKVYCDDDDDDDDNDDVCDDDVDVDDDKMSMFERKISRIN